MPVPVKTRRQCGLGASLHHLLIFLVYVQLNQEIMWICKVERFRLNGFKAEII